MTVLLGANGAGKSTLLRLAAMLDAPSGGRIEVGGHDSRKAGAAARAVLGVVGQEPGLYDELTVRENAMLVARFYRKEFALDAAARACGIVHKLDARVRTLSRGEKQRAALTRALCAGPLLLLDEPTTSLDAQGRAQVADMLADLRDTRTILVATHEESIVSVADRVLVLENGRLKIDAGAAEGRAWMEALA